MSVFDGAIQTPLAVPDPGTDHMLPAPGSLNYSGITAHTALAGTQGVDALLLHGNRDRQMNGSESTRIAGSRTHAVSGSQHKKIGGNKSENVVGNFAQMTLGNLNRSTVGATSDLYTGAHTLEHKSSQLLQQPGTYMHSIQERVQKGQAHTFDLTDYTLVTSSATECIGTKAEYTGSKVSISESSAQQSFIDANQSTIQADNTLIQR